KHAPEQLAEVILGDIAGVLFPMPGKERDRLFLDCASRWTGIRKSDIAKVASDAQEKNTPGSIVVALGAVKSVILHEILKSGLVSRLFVDDDLDGSLRQLIERGKSK